MNRLERGTRIVSWTETRDICVGYANCSVCKAETPEPTSSQLIEFAKTRTHGGYMWPDRDVPGCTPVNWVWDNERGWLCPECTDVVIKALAKRRK